MVDGVQFLIRGLDSLAGKFESISDDLKRKGGRASLRKASQVIATAAKANASALDDPQSSESIAKNITVRWSGRLNKRTGDLGFRVGVLGGAKGFAAASGELKGQGKNNPGGDTYHWRFLEFGTQKMRAQPFMRRALSDNINKATSTFITEYEKAIDRAIKRAAKRGEQP